MRFRLEPDGPGIYDLEVILDGIAAAGNHDGGALAFGPDGMLYAGVGDAGNPDNAQDPDSLNGKILRMDPLGNPPIEDPNPDPDSLVWSMGHRNVQGLAWDDDGRLWATEFGQNAFDEVNLIEPGGNYGWPVVEGDGRRRAVHRTRRSPGPPTRPARRAPRSSTTSCTSGRCAASGCGGSRSPTARRASRRRCCRTTTAGCATWSPDLTVALDHHQQPRRPR